MQRKAAVAKSEAVFRYLPGAEENQENLNPNSITKGQNFYPKPTTYEQGW
jgi:hypothetical protein